MNTRALGGSIPGPTLKLLPGDTLKITFNNKLQKQDGVETRNNYFRLPDSSNLHTHGLHTSPIRPGDDVTLLIEPGASFNYVFKIPADHMPGTHWLHTHLHGSAAIQVGGGASMALIVEDPAKSLPTDIESAKDVLMVIHRFQLKDLGAIADKSQDKRFNYTTSKGDIHYLVNGLN